MEDTGVKSYCPNCKVYEVRDGNYCSGCGSELELPPPTLKCPKCHEEVRSSDGYCINCGTILKAD